jgi:energy-coupling factor transporter ATP-binding protein EcfA2
MMDGTHLENEIITSLSRLFLNASEESIVEGLDADLIAYIAGMLSSTILEQHDSHNNSESRTETIDEVLIPFLESVHCPDALIRQAKDLVEASIVECCGPADGPNGMSHLEPNLPNNENRKLQQGIVKMSLLQEDMLDESKHLWTMNGNTVKAMANELIDAHQDKSSMRDKRKQRKLLVEQERKALSSKNDMNIDEEGSGLVHMNVRSFSSQNSSGQDKTRDIQVRNVTVSLNNGTTLLESGEIKFSYQRRYGLIGENGVGKLFYDLLMDTLIVFFSHICLYSVCITGKSTLLKAIANGGIDGFPTHLRILHVRQEVPSHFSDAVTVLNAVLQSDVERNLLLDREKELQQKLEQGSGNNSAIDGEDAHLSLEEKRKKLSTRNAADMKTLEADLKELDDIYARLQVLSADSAEARAAMILSGLQFTVAMQQGPVSALSGGWRMRVALAAALFIEPDLLMLVCSFIDVFK